MATLEDQYKENASSGTLSAADFTPIDEVQRGPGTGFKAGVVIVSALALVALGVMIYLLNARAVIFHLIPEYTQLDIAGVDFNLGNNYLVLPGQRDISARAEGYISKDLVIDVTGDATQEVSIALKPLPGNLQVTSALDDISVFVDGELKGSAPGVIADVEQGLRELEFKKYRYFSLKKALEVDGLGKTQNVDVELQPAWGWLQISTEPQGAAISVDGNDVAVTPAQVEILETGSQVSIAAAGYKTWEQQLTTTAGQTSEYPTIKLEVADGTLLLSSMPAGAGVTIEGKYVGVTPVQAAVSPLKQYSVDFFLEGYLKTSRSVAVESERQRTVNVSLKPDIGKIRLSVIPADAVIRIDGNVMGTGSTDLALPAKRHQLEVVKKGYQTHRVAITPKPGQQQSLNITLLTLQQAYWSKRPPTITSPVGTTLKLFRPDGKPFTLGAPRREPGRRANETERRVLLERPFYLGLKEITNEQVRQWRSTHSSSSLRGHSLDLDQQPAVMLSWQDVALFCNWLSEKQGLPLFYKISAGKVSGINWQSTGYRLPTEAEWAWAAKVDGDGRARVFPWGNNLYPPAMVVENYADPSAASLVNFALADYPDGYPVSASVGSFPANHRGLYDMGGNVAEWVNDYYDIQGHKGTPLVDPRGPDQGDRYVVRGASWTQGSRSDLRLSARRVGVNGELDVGFRIARYVDNGKAAQ